VVAAALSFLFPGLGQAAAGDRRRGVIVAIPVLATLAGFAAILIFDRSSLFGLALNQGWLTSLLILDLVAFIYHLWAIVDSYLLARKAQPEERRVNRSAAKWAPILGVVVIMTGAIGVHAGVAEVDMSWQHALYCLTAETPCWVTDDSMANASLPPDEGDDNPVVTDPGEPNPSGSAASVPPLTTFDPSSLPSFEVTSNRTDWSTGQLNVLLIGADFGPNRSGLRPDTMIVLHVDIATRRAALIGVGRNTACVPLPADVAQHYAKPNNGCPSYTWSGYPNNPASAELNWLAMEAWNHPANFPSYPQDAAHAWFRGALATEQAVGVLTGLTMDGFVTINLDGLAALIDDLGGIDINVPTKVFDEPCGPAGTWAAKWYQSANCVPIHGGYNVPVANDFSVVQQMIDDAAKSGGKQTITPTSSTTKYGTDIAFTIYPGVQHMSGQWALAYARTREFTTDFNRMLRQQIVLKAIRTKVADPCALLPDLGSLVGDLGGAFNTNLPLNDANAVRQFAGLAKLIAGNDLPPPIEIDPTQAGMTYIGNKAQGYYPAVDSTSWNYIKTNVVGTSLDNAQPGTGGDGSTSGGGFSC
jgi:anionic cell wall polymer biosynthesis LytR-Cps2A-Psr (LCP) family protein